MQFSEEEFHLTSVSDDVFHDEYNHQDKTLSYCAALSTDLNSSILDCVNPRVYTAKRKTVDPDTPTFMKVCIYLILFYTQKL